MNRKVRINRRCFFSNGVALAVPLMIAPRKDETVYRFETPDWNIQMTVKFYDRYASRGFWFTEQQSSHAFCLSGSGQESRDCLDRFTGSLAVAQYLVHPRSTGSRLTFLKEHVRTIDQDDRLSTRAPFDRTIELRDGVASDIQVFGYVPETTAVHEQAASERNGPWCLLRQDLYFDEQHSPFLVVHWKHTLGAIRILDVVPWGQTRMLEK
jgi:hypothetical protein